MAISKIILTNRTETGVKYGAAGRTLIDEALQRLVAADLARGVTTAIVAIDDANAMAAFGGAAVINGKDEKGAKDAVDAIFSKANPDYLVLLDGPDVIPHIALNAVPGLTDGDQQIDSDLPYACASPFSRQPKAYLAVTRVVGRLPLESGAVDASRLADLLDRAAAHKPREPAEFGRFFAISAQRWQQSTQLSLRTIFGSHAALHISPLAGHTTIDPDLKCAAHFINCHGGSFDHRFYGQSGGSYPVAMDSTLMTPHLTPGTVVASECCYGAQLYDYNLAGVSPPICTTYLSSGAAAFFGSTTISYGQANANGQADLLTQYFMEFVLAGASTGRAALQARQRFVSTQVMSSPVNLKTLAQFVLYGDPSLVATTPTPRPSDPEDAARDELDVSEARTKLKRISLTSSGAAFASAATSLRGPASISAALSGKIHDIAKRRGYTSDARIYDISGGSRYRQAAKAADASRRIAIVTDRLDDHVDLESGARLLSYKVFTAHMLDETIVSIEECESR